MPGERFSKSMKPGGDPVDFIATMDDVRPRLDMVEKLLDDTYADVLLNSFPREFEFIKQRIIGIVPSTSIK